MNWLPYGWSPGVIWFVQILIVLIEIVGIACWALHDQCKRQCRRIARWRVQRRKIQREVSV